MPKPQFPGPVPQDAIDFFEAKKLKVGFDFRDVWREEHAVDFTVAKISELDLLQDVQDSIATALKEGQTERTWAKGLTPELQKRGWWGVQEQVDPLTGEKRLVQLGSPRRLKTIYDANMRTARAAGQWERIQRTKDTHPYLLYQLGPSEHHREQHVAWQGLLLPADDDFWASHMPPNGWGCKCWVRQVSRREHERLMNDGFQDPLAPQEINPDTGLPTGRRVTQKIPVKTQAPTVRYRKWVNKRTGEIERVPVGIDPGWDTNPGHVTRRHAIAKRFMQAVNGAAPGIGAQAMAETAQFVLPDVDASYRAWVKAIDAGELEGAGGRRTIGAIAPEILDALKEKTGVVPSTAGLTIEQREIHHLLAEARKGDKALTRAQVFDLVKHLAAPRAVIWDGAGKRPALLYVFDDPADAAGRLGRIAVRIDFVKGETKLNAIRSGSRVPKANLEQPGMIRLDQGKEL